MKVRLAPSSTNPSMWRCVPGSSFFTAELCNPGDRELAPATVLGNLETTIDGMGLDGGVANDLEHRIDDVVGRLDPDPQASCGGLDGLLQRLLDTSGQEKPKLTLAQAASLVATVNSVEDTIGCTDDTALVPKAQAEQDVLALLGTIAGLPLDNGVASDLRNGVRDAGKQIAGGPVTSACATLADLGRKISDRTGKKNGLAAAQAAQLESARAALAAELGC
jgi:hypothetical protein